MNSKIQKRSILKAQFNTLEINQEDPTILKGTVIIHDFDRSWNNQVISEEVCVENMDTLVGKRIVCKYIPSEDNNGVDALTDHEEIIGKDRDTGQDAIFTDTIAIGFIESVFIDDYVNEEGHTKKALYGNIVIWNDDKYANIVGLLQEWIDRGVKIHMSVEYLYCNYNVVEGVEYLQSPILYVAHTLLNSEERGEYAEIMPAYDCATLINLNERQQWNKTINQLSKTSNNTGKIKINNKSENNIYNSDLNIKNNQMEGDKMADKTKMFKKVCELSFSDIRSQIYTRLQETLSENEYYDSYITECYDTYFILSYWNDTTHKYFKVIYTKENDIVTIDWINRAEVSLYQEWREIPEVQSSLNAKTKELSLADEKITDLEKQLNTKEEVIKSLNEKINSTNIEKVEIENKFNDVTDKLTSLNSMVENMKPIVDEYNKEQYEKLLNQIKYTYEKKFKSVNALEKFESEEVQELIKKALNENEEGKNAITSLNKMVVDLITFDGEIDTETKPIKELCSKQEKLIPNDSFEARYGF